MDIATSALQKGVTDKEHRKNGSLPSFLSTQLSGKHGFCKLVKFIEHVHLHATLQ
jgi:hypothetical protein